MPTGTVEILEMRKNIDINQFETQPHTNSGTDPSSLGGMNSKNDELQQARLYLFQGADA